MKRIIPKWLLGIMREELVDRACELSIGGHIDTRKKLTLFDLRKGWT